MIHVMCCLDEKLYGLKLRLCHFLVQFSNFYLISHRRTFRELNVTMLALGSVS